MKTVTLQPAVNPRRRERIGAVLLLRSSYGQGVLQGVRDYLTLHPEWALVVLHADEVAGSEQLEQYGLRGLIMHLTGDDQREAAERLRIPLVNVSNRALGATVTTVTSDDREAGRMAARCLLERGYRKLAYLGQGRKRSYVHRWEGFEEVAAAAGTEVNSFWVGGSGPAEFYQAREQARMREWLEGQSRPLGVLVSSDRFATFFVDFVLQLGWQVPEDAAVVGVDNDELRCGLALVPLSSVQLGAEMIGYRAAKLLAEKIAGARVAEETVLIPPVRVVERASTEHVAVSSPELGQELRRVTEHLETLRSVGELAAFLNTSRRTLERRWRAQLGVSPHAELARLRLWRAQVLLRETVMSCAEVAQAVGLPDNRSLTVLFRRMAATTPTAYRRSQWGPTGLRRERASARR